MERDAFFVAVFQARAVQKQKSELCPGRIWELSESRLTQSSHFKLTFPLKQSYHCYWTLLLASDHTLRACSRWRKTCSCVGNLVFRREVSTEISMRLPLWGLDNDTSTGWMMPTEPLWVTTTSLKATWWNEFALAISRHALFSIVIKEALHSFSYDDKKGYFLRKNHKQAYSDTVWKKKQTNILLFTTPNNFYYLYEVRSLLCKMHSTWVVLPKRTQFSVSLRIKNKFQD